MPSLKDLTPEDRHRRKKPVEEVKIEYPPGTPISYTADYIKDYQKKYYQENRDKILARANQRYKDLKAAAADE